MSQQPKADASSDLTVADMAPGTKARVVSLKAVNEVRREQLLAYGVAPGRYIQVLQHKPATILKVDHTELAIEDDVARRIIVEESRRLGKKYPRRHKRRRHRLRGKLNFLRRRRGRKRKH